MAGVVRDLLSHLTAVALACPVCVGSSDALMAHASNAGIATLMAVTLIVLAGITGVALRIATRVRAARAIEIEIEMETES